MSEEEKILLSLFIMIATEQANASEPFRTSCTNMLELVDEDYVSEFVNYLDGLKGNNDDIPEPKIYQRIIDAVDELKNSDNLRRIELAA